jgi:hypothetical protein
MDGNCLARFQPFDAQSFVSRLLGNSLVNVPQKNLGQRGTVDHENMIYTYIYMYDNNNRYTLYTYIYICMTIIIDIHYIYIYIYATYLFIFVVESMVIT